MRTGDRTVCKVTRKWEECLGRAGSEWCDEVCTRAGGRHRKACPVLSLNNGAHFPLAGPTGKRDPQFRVIPGRAFPDRPEAESVSRSEPLFWDAVSAEPFIKEKDPFAEVLVNSRWRGRESRPRAARTDRCGAYAFTQLRDLTGFDSMWGLHKRKGPLCRGPSQFKVAGKGIEPLTRGFSVLCSTN